MLDRVDDLVHDTMCEIVRRQGPCEVDLLIRRARRVCRDARIDVALVEATVDGSTILVGLPDGRVDYLIRVLDGAMFTQRVRAATNGRRDLWTTAAVQPLVAAVTMHPLPLASGGELSLAEHGLSAVFGPDGWLPDVPALGLVALGISAGAVTVRAVSFDELPSLPEQQQVREVIAAHYRRERWWSGEDDLESRPGELVRAITYAHLEHPGIFARPYPPLDELLHDPLEQQVDEHHWREFAACRQDHTVSFPIVGMPEALHIELTARARLYGMSFDQYTIAVLGHLAWRTPFAEDMRPWEMWSPDSRPAPDLTVTHLAHERPAAAGE